MTPQNILIDTDLGDDVDDLLALAFALLRPELSVKAITAVSYETDLRCHLIQRLLSSLNRSDVLFAPGLKLPLRPASPQERENSLSPTGYILNQYPIVREEDKVTPPATDAIELIARVVKENPGNITLICIGPLTNIATALCRYPEIIPQIKQIALMGNLFDLWDDLGIAAEGCSYPEIIPQIKQIALMGGELNLNRREHNINWDSNAAEIVFTSGIPLFIGTWDVTRGFVLTPEDCEAIAQNPSLICQLMHEAIQLWWPYKAHKPSPVMYDVSPILWTYAPDYFTTESMEVKVETGGHHTRGYTVRAWGEPNAQVSQTMQSEAVRQLYLDTLLGAE